MTLSHETLLRVLNELLAREELTTRAPGASARGIDLSNSHVSELAIGQAAGGNIITIGSLAIIVILHDEELTCAREGAKPRRV
jgi:hypothetical protein